MKLNENIPLDFKKNWKFFTILVVSVLLMLLFTTYIVSVTNKLYDITDVKKATGVVEEVTIGTVLEEQFLALEDNLEKLIYGKTLDHCYNV